MISGWLASVYDPGGAHPISLPLLSLVMPRTVKIVRSSLAYPPVSLLADIGGYFGLMLGISLHQLADIVIDLLVKLCNRSNYVPELNTGDRGK